MSDVYISPELIASLAVLITAMTGLILAIRGMSAVTVTQKAVASTQTAVVAHGAVMEKVLKQTNGAAAAASDRMTVLEGIVAQLAIAHAPLPPTPPVTPGPGPKPIPTT
jgi:molybdopterin biosynthesis enzyme MoaB